LLTGIGLGFWSFQGINMGKSIALFFASAALVILAGSFVSPRSVAANQASCSPAYGVDPCATEAAGH
jgi:hypothetical protein